MTKHRYAFGLAMAAIMATGNAIAQTAAAQPAQSVRVVMGLMVMSSDKVVLSKVQTDFAYAMPFKTLKEKFSDKRYVVKEWGKRSAIIIDKLSGPIGAKSRSLSALTSICDKLDANGIVQLGKLDAETRENLMTLLGVPQLYADGSDPDSGAVGVSLTMSFTIQSGFGGPPITHLMPPRGNSETAKQQKQSLAEHPIPFRKPADEQELKAATASFVAKAGDDNELGAHLYGIASANLPEGLSIATPVIQAIYQELDAANAALTNQLASKLKNGRTLPGDAGKYSDLPPALQQQLMDNFKNNWKYYGFTSPDQAADFLSNATSLQVNTAVTLNFDMPGDPRTGNVPSGLSEMPPLVGGSIALPWSPGGHY